MGSGPGSRLPRLAETAVERARLDRRPAPADPGAADAVRRSWSSLVLLGGVVGLLLFNTSMQQVSFTATSLEARAERLRAEEQRLQMELDELRDPQRVAAAGAGARHGPAGTPRSSSSPTARSRRGRPGDPLDAQRLRRSRRAARGARPRPIVVDEARSPDGGRPATAAG